jgi:hypothetical protein
MKMILRVNLLGESAIPHAALGHSSGQARLYEVHNPGMDEGKNQEVEPGIPKAVKKILPEVGEVIELHRMAEVPSENESPIVDAPAPVLKPGDDERVVALRDRGHEPDADENPRAENQKQDSHDEKRIAPPAQELEEHIQEAIYFRDVGMTRRRDRIISAREPCNPRG